MMELAAVVDTVKATHMKLAHEYRDAIARANRAIVAMKIGNPNASEEFERAVRDTAMAQMSIEVLKHNWGQYLSIPRMVEQGDNEGGSPTENTTSTSG